MGKPAVSSGALRVGLSILGVTVAAVATVLNGVEFPELVSGGLEAWKKLGVAVLIAVGGAIFGWTKKFLTDFDVSELPLEWVTAQANGNSIPMPEPTSGAVAPTEVELPKASD